MRLLLKLKITLTDTMNKSSYPPDELHVRFLKISSAGRDLLSFCG
ncbi:hypothetical protein Lbys_0980 [Leadbetterella byssophila DSM 17132]|uniref:Uncharacterized protein n=1 Tax=Leadbetterella byssophila (strain DSM 17132 / JCM 16389 / KACC 11308 / NBRC 106382 / 4M15) TaxID=649349 RepID=E4RRQ6_LEAB4|nr:hypothetical protein Lbys_0980 [Leadbetterella byssophila DSM 17132]